jgi:PAS domain S-box-containing protein
MDKPTLLYIEDEAAQREGLSAALETRGYTVLCAESGERGLETLAGRSVDVILCDLNMPGLGGIDVLRAVEKSGARTPVVILTSRGTVELAVRAIREGAADFIRKPPDLDEIDVSIANALERRRLRERLEAYSEDLEAAVRERTSELEEAYAQLADLNKNMEREVRARTEELEEHAIALAQANVDLLGAQEELEAKNRELLRAEERMVTIIDASPVPLVVTRLSDGKIVYANRLLGELVGSGVEGMMGRDAPDFYEDPRDRREVVNRLKSGEPVQSLEVRMKRPDGSPVWMMLSSTLTELSGEPVLVSGLYDIDERKKAESALRESEELFRGIVENAHDIIFTAGPDNRITYVSPNVEELLGYEPSDLVGSWQDSLIHRDDRDRLRGFYRDVVESRRQGAHFDCRMIHKNGETRWYSIAASVVTDANDEPRFIAGIAHDFTTHREFVGQLEQKNEELQRTQSQLVQSEKMAALGTLVAGIAHEINTPIGAVSSMHDTLTRSLAKVKETLDAAGGYRMETLFGVVDDSNKVIRSGIERVMTIVRRLRSFARLDEAELKTIDVNEGIEDTLTLVHHELKHNVTVNRQYGKIPPLACFPGRLNQVFLNLLVNARQAIRGEGTIDIETRMEGRRFVAVFTDSGVGIPPENLDRIFDPGFTTKGVGVGTGLGLSICYGIVQDHFGEISVESEVGRGTRFTIRIPDNLGEYYNEDGSLKKRGT